MKTSHHGLLPMTLLLLVGLLFGCGTGEDFPSPAQGGPFPSPGSDLSYQDPDDFTVTSIDLNTSFEYDGDLDEVRMFAVVKDQNGVSLEGLNRYNFTVVVEPKSAPKTVAAEDTELTLAFSDDRVVGLVIDSSGSMLSPIDETRTRMQVAKEAAKLFTSLMGAGDRVAVVDFDTTTRTVQSLTDDRDAIDREIDRMVAEGATNLGAALAEAVRAVGTRPGKRAVILLGDGDDTMDAVQGGPEVWLNDTTGKSTRLQGLNLARNSELVVYTIGLGSDLSATGLADLQTFATETGGTFFQATTASALLSALGQTIPREVDGLQPVQTYLLQFPNRVPPVPGQSITVPVTAIVRYRNGLRTHRDDFNDAYTVR
ncbi:MAG: vWA domain-containing protein [Deferrisomatales bacterium]